MGSFRMLLAGLCLSSTTTLSQPATSVPCLQLVGQVIDYATQQPIADAEFIANVYGIRKHIANRGIASSFSINVSCETTSLIIEKSGYRPQILPLNLHRLSAGKLPKPMALLIPLVAVDKQEHDRPYLQTEQTDYVQNVEKYPSQAGNTNSVQHGSFIITDAVGGFPVPAQACFFFTQTQVKKCINANAQGKFNFDFTQTDIVAIEVNAPGYQTYAGNIRVERLDNKLLRHEVRLLRELTLLTIQAPVDKQYKLRSSGKSIAMNKVPDQPGWFSAYGLSEQRYELVITGEGQTTKRAIALNKGLNYTLISARPAKPLPNDNPVVLEKKNIESERVSDAFLSTPDELKQVYFEQSSYVLRSDSQLLLHQVATYLKSHSDYKVYITGYTDNVGPEYLNRNLSEYRARVTANFLNRQGIHSDRLITAGNGSRNPIVPNDTEENKARNRRVSLQLIIAQ